MGFYTKIDYSRQMRQYSGQTAILSGNTFYLGNFRAMNNGFSYSSACTQCSSGATLLVGSSIYNSAGNLTEDCTHGVAITTYSGITSATTVLSIGQAPLDPIDRSNPNVPAFSATCLQINRSNLLAADKDALGIDSNGNIYIDTSTKRVKYDIRNTDILNLENLLSLETKRFRWKADKTEAIGLIAEEVHDLGLTDFVSYEIDGKTPRGVNYKLLTLAIIEYLKKGHTPKVNTSTETTKKECLCEKDVFIVLDEDVDYTLDSHVAKKYVIKSLANCNVFPDKGYIDNQWESLEMLPESCVEFRYYEPMSSWMIVSSDGIKES